jgi:hypothetical protein
MRQAAQFALALVAIYAALLFKAPILFYGWVLFAPLLLVPIAWYVIFDRHREVDHLEPLLMELRLLRNAIAELNVQPEAPARSAARGA